MSNNKQSSVEWYSHESFNLKLKLEKKEISIGEYAVTYVELLNKAKAMHKEEIKNAWESDRQFVFMDSELDELSESTINDLSENYYNETFNNNETI